MTIVQINSGVNTASATSFTATLTNPASASNRVVLFIAGDTTVTTLSGWTARAPQVNFMGHYLFDKVGAADNSWTWANAAGQITWVCMEIAGGVYDTHAGANATAAATTYVTPNLTPTAGTRIVIASLASLANFGGSTARTLSGWTNSFVEQADRVHATSPAPMQGVAVLDNLAANGSTAYSTTGTFSASSEGRSAVIASYVTTAGGASLTASPADTAGITDSVTADLTTGGSSLTATPADTAGITDAAGTAVARAVTVNDLVGITDLGGPQQLDIGLTLAESVGVTDAASSVSARALIVADIVGLLDAAGTAATRVVGVADTVGATDATQADKGQLSAVADTVGITDTVGAVADRTSILADTAGLTDAVDTAASRVVSISDAIGTTDTVQADKGQLSNVSDTAGITDAAGTTSDRVTGPADTVGLTDTVTVDAARILTVTDTAGITDSVQADLTVGGNNLAANVGDVVGLLDATGTTSERVVTVTDTLGVVDQPTTAAVRVLTVSDTVGVTGSAGADLTVGGNALTATIADSIGITDTAGYALARAVDIGDLIGAADAVTLTKAWTVTLSDTVSVSDFAGAPAGPARDVTFTAVGGTHSWTAQGGYPVEMSTLSREYVTVRLTSTAGNGSPAVAFDAQQVHMALVPTGTAAQLNQFYLAEWVGAVGTKRWCRMLVGPSGGVATFTPGVYDRYVRVEDASETPVQKVTVNGQVTFV